MRKTKVVVTGGAGFIGSHIVEYWLSEGAEVHIIDNLRSGFISNVVLFPDAAFHYGSITDKSLVDEVFKDADYVHHLAALISVPESVERPYECIEINLIGLLNVLEASRKFGVKKIVLSSSAAVYGENPESPKTTKTLPAPKSPYGITKLDGEYYLNMYKELYGLGAVSLRYFNVFGPRQDPKSQYAAAVPIFITKALKDDPITIYGDGEQTRDFIFVKDVVQANILAAKNEDVNGVFNVALGNSTSIKTLAETIISLTESKSDIHFHSERKGDIKHSLADIQKIKKELNFNPNFDLESSLKLTIDYFKQIGI
ncbi:MAG: SDR family oxidoreductase [Melioribacteraceae bacterium]|jgi:UDP-glucose 4-epimerase|nr:SDR family oxidoreductase [Melioribacteraceae bacterium]